MTNNYLLPILYESQNINIEWDQNEITTSEIKNEVIRQLKLFPIKKLHIRLDDKEYSDETSINIHSLGNKPLRIIPEVGIYPNNLTPKDIIMQYLKINKLEWDNSDNYDIIFKFSDNNKVISDLSPKEILSGCYIIPKVTNHPMEFDNTVFENKIAPEIPKQTAKKDIQAKFINFEGEPEEKILRIKKVMQWDELSQVIHDNFDKKPFKIFYKYGNKVEEIEHWKAYILSENAEILFIVKQAAKNIPQNSSQNSVITIPQNSSSIKPQSTSQQSSIHKQTEIPNNTNKNGSFIEQFKKEFGMQQNPRVLLAELYYYKTSDLMAAFNIYRKSIDWKIQYVNKEIENIIIEACKNIMVNDEETIKQYIKDYLKLNNGNYPNRLSDFFDVDLTKIDNPLELKDNVNI